MSIAFGLNTLTKTKSLSFAVFDFSFFFFFQSAKKSNEKEKKKSNLELFKEELKQYVPIFLVVLNGLHPATYCQDFVIINVEQVLTLKIVSLQYFPTRLRRKNYRIFSTVRRTVLKSVVSVTGDISFNTYTRRTVLSNAGMVKKR